MLYLLIVLFLLSLSCCYDVNGRTRYKNFYYSLVLILFVLVAGLRYRLGVDTSNYIYRFYYQTPLLWDLTLDDLEIGSDPLYTLLNSFVLSLGGHFYFVQLFHALFVNFLIFKYIKKHSRYIFTCVFFYFIYIYFAYNMEEMRASMCLVLCLFGNDYMLEKKWLKGLCLYFVGILFHFSAIVLLLTPIVLLLKFNLWGVGAIVASYFLGVFLKPLIEEYLVLLDFSEELTLKVQGHMNNDTYAEKLNLNMFAYVGIATLYAYPVFYLTKLKKGVVIDGILKLEPFFVLYFIILAANISLPLLYRYVHFYTIYMIILISHVAVYILKSIRIRNVWQKYLFGTIILTPMLFYLIKGYIDEKWYRRYYPYSSVIERDIDKEREKIFSYYEINKVSLNKY